MTLSYYRTAALERVRWEEFSADLENESTYSATSEVNLWPSPL